jgi:hypothetical protein
MDFWKGFQKLDTCHKAESGPAGQSAFLSDTHCNNDARRPDLGVYLALAAALLTYAGIAWAAGWL